MAYKDRLWEYIVRFFHVKSIVGHFLHPFFFVSSSSCLLPSSIQLFPLPRLSDASTTSLVTECRWLAMISGDYCRVTRLFQCLRTLRRRRRRISSVACRTHREQAWKYLTTGTVGLYNSVSLRPHQRRIGYMNQKKITIRE